MPYFNTILVMQVWQKVFNVNCRPQKDLRSLNHCPEVTNGKDFVAKVFIWFYRMWRNINPLNVWIVCGCYMLRVWQQG